MTTLADISKYLGLSMATVSRALNDFPEVNANTKARVKAVAARMGYQPNSIAKQLATGKSKLVGIMLDTPEELICAPTFLKELSYISRHLGLLGYDLLINASFQGKSLASLEHFIDKSNVDGMIIKAPLVNDQRIQLLQNRRIPFVVHGQDTTMNNYAFYDIDNASVITQSLTLLYHLGHRRIVFINGDEQQAYAKVRGDTFRKLVDTLGLDSNLCCVKPCLPEVTDGLHQARLLLANESRPTALICSSVKVAFGAYSAANELGLEIGYDLSIIAHDDQVSNFDTREFHPPLTVTYAPLTDSSKPLAEIITKLIDGTPIERLQVHVPVELIVRQSTGQATTVTST